MLGGFSTSNNERNAFFKWSIYLSTNRSGGKWFQKPNFHVFCVRPPKVCKGPGASFHSPSDPLNRESSRVEPLLLCLPRSEVANSCLFSSQTNRLGSPSTDPRIRAISVLKSSLGLFRIILGCWWKVLLLRFLIEMPFFFFFIFLRISKAIGKLNTGTRALWFLMRLIWLSFLRGSIFRPCLIGDRYLPSSWIGS